MKTRIVIALVCAAVLAPGALAQEGEEFDPRKVIKEIQEDLSSLVDEYAALSSGKSVGESGKRIVDNIDKLLEGIQNSQDRIVDNIDEIIKQKKKSSSSSSSSSQQQQQQQQQQGKPQSRDRNQQQKDRQRNQRQQGKKPDGEQQPKGSEHESQRPEQSKGGRKAPGSKEERVPFVDDANRWGLLPPETRQLLIENNFREYFPDYQREISDYLRSLNRKKR